MKDVLLNVSEASGEIGVSPDTIRRWEKKGLIKARRSDLNHRLFSLAEIKTLNDKLFGDPGRNNYKIHKSKQKTPFNTIELFAGAGGTALGFENAGFRHSLLVEWDKNAVATLRKNRPEWEVMLDDIANVNFDGMEADVIEGGFPCQSFSYAGRKAGFEDARGTMFFELARSIRSVRPKIAMGENVRGLLRHDDGRTLQTIVGILQELGYRVAYKVLKAQYFDVPQKRERLIILAVRNDLPFPFLFPQEKNYTISLREALEECPKSPGQDYPKRKKEILSLVPPGGYWRSLPLPIQMEYMQASYYLGGGKTGMARRLSWDEPSLTLTCAPAQKQTERCHPEETRPLTVREYARIQTFPDDWEFAGSVSSQYKQIGNAVPVNLGFHVGMSIRAMLEGKTAMDGMESIKPGEEGASNASVSGSEA